MLNETPMVPRVRDIWAESVLDAHQFGIGRQFLCHKMGPIVLHDPLGILCEIGIAHNVIPEGLWCGDSDVLRFKRYGYEREQGVLPKEIVEWAWPEGGRQLPRVYLNRRDREILQLPMRYRMPGMKLLPISLAAINDYGSVSRERLAQMIRSL